MDKNQNAQGIKALKSAELVSRLTKLEHDIKEIRMYDRHLGIESLNRYNKRSRKERMTRNVKQVLKDIVVYGLPYIVAIILMAYLMNLGA